MITANVTLVDQNNSLLPALCREEGCCWLTLVAMPQYLAGVYLAIHTITYLWSNDILGKTVNADGFVTDDNAVIDHAALETTHMSMPTIIRLAGPIASSQVGLEARTTHGLVFAQRHITMRGASHYMLYDGELKFLFNPKPDYAIAGEEDWYFYGVKNAL